MKDNLSLPYKAATHDEIEDALSKQTKIDGCLFLDSRPYTPYKWSVFLIFAAIIGFSIWILFSNYFLGDIPPIGFLNQSLLAALVGVILGLPLGIYYLLNLLSPAKLLIDEAGVTLYGFRNKKQVKWTEIDSIFVKNPYEGYYNKSVLITTIRGKLGTLKWGPDFGIDPNSLKDFLNRQKSLFVSNQND